MQCLEFQSKIPDPLFYYFNFYWSFSFFNSIQTRKLRFHRDIFFMKEKRLKRQCLKFLFQKKAVTFSPFFLSSSCFLGVCARFEEMTLVWGSHGPTTNVYIAKWLSACLPHCCSPFRRHGSPPLPPAAASSGAHVHALIVHSVFLHFQLWLHRSAAKESLSNQNSRILWAFSLLFWEL